MGEKGKYQKPTEWMGWLPGSHPGSNSAADMESWEKRAMTEEPRIQKNK